MISIEMLIAMEAKIDVCHQRTRGKMLGKQSPQFSSRNDAGRVATDGRSCRRMKFVMLSFMYVQPKSEKEWKRAK